MSKKPVLYFAAGILVIALLWSYLKQNSQDFLQSGVKRNQEAASEKKQALTTTSPSIKKDLGLSQIIRRADSLPSELRTASSQKERFFSSEINGYLIRAKATFKKVIVPNKTYGLSLSGQEKITVRIDKNTLIAKAWYGFDKNNELIRIQYKTITLEEFNQQLSAGKIVSIGYNEKDYIKGEELPLMEFVLLE